MMSNMTKQWLRQNLGDVKALAQAGVTVCKNILNARNLYMDKGDSRWLNNLETNINTYERWSMTVEGKAALENIRQPKESHHERRGAQRNKTTRVNMSKPAARPAKQTRNQRTIR